MDMELQHFIQMLEWNPPGTPEHAAAMWESRADAWAKDYDDPDKRKSDDRIQVTVDYLTKRGLLDPDFDVADVGCGPGRFVVAFARMVRHVTGIDISEKMIRYGMEYAEKENLSNTAFLVRDFQALDIEQENLAGRFDLVFCSITPAMHGIRGVENAMKMSRKYCCHISHINSTNELESRIMREVFGRERPDPWAGHWRWFYAVFNVLFLMGYYPEATYYNRHQDKAIFPERERAELLVRQLLPAEEHTPENKERVYAWLQSNADNGRLTEASDVLYGRLLWDVREKTERPVSL